MNGRMNLEYQKNIDKNKNWYCAKRMAYSGGFSELVFGTEIAEPGIKLDLEVESNRVAQVISKFL